MHDILTHDLMLHLNNRLNIINTIACNDFTVLEMTVKGLVSNLLSEGQKAIFNTPGLYFPFLECKAFSK